MKWESPVMANAVSDMTVSGGAGAPMKSGGVGRALKSASERTGVQFDYLYKVAVRESGLDPSARARTSSAAGLFQFVEQTWLEAVKQYGSRHGLAEAADKVTMRADGKYAVADKEARQGILDLRLKPDNAAALAAELAVRNRSVLESKLGRKVDAPELYAAHFLGASGAAKLLSAPADASGAALLPAAAKANRPVFYDGARAKSVAEIMGDFRKTIGGPQRAAPAPEAKAAALEGARPRAVSEIMASFKSTIGAVASADAKERLPAPAPETAGERIAVNADGSGSVGLAMFMNARDARGAPTSAGAASDRLRDIPLADRLSADRVTTDRVTAWLSRNGGLDAGAPLALIMLDATEGPLGSVFSRRND